MTKKYKLTVCTFFYICAKQNDKRILKQHLYIETFERNRLAVNLWLAD